MKELDVIKAIERILGWYKDPNALVDDDIIVPPSKFAMQSAIHFLVDDVLYNISESTIAYDDWTMTGVTVGGDGEIAIQMDNGSKSNVIQYEKDGSGVRLKFENNRLISKDYYMDYSY